MKPGSEEQITEWTVRYLDGELDGSELERLNAALESSPKARQVFDEVSQQAFYLADPGESQPSRQPPARNRIAITVIGIAAAVMVMLVVLQRPPAVAEEVALLRVGESPVSLLLDESGELIRRVSPEEELSLKKGEGFRIHDHGASVETIYPDGTRFSVFGQSEVRLDESNSGGKRIVVLTGQVVAEVTPQPDGKPLIIQTPTSSIEVLGTRLDVNADANATQVAVSSGRVALIRSADGARIEVPAGRSAQTSHSNKDPLTAEVTPPRLADHWEANFDTGLPAGWKCGKWLPENGAILAHPNPRNGYKWFTISSGNAWSAGRHSHFQIHEDSVLHLTYKMERPEWFQIMLNLRSTPASKAGTGNAFYENARQWNRDLTPGVWRTIHIPLNDYSKFIGRNRKLEDVDLVGLAAFQVYLSSHADDHGLVVDRIWVTRQGAHAQSL